MLPQPTNSPVKGVKRDLSDNDFYGRFNELLK